MQGEPNDEKRATARGLDHAHAAAVQFGELLDDGKAQAGAAETALGATLDLTKPLEHRFAQIGRHTGAVVLHLDDRLTRLLAQAHVDTTTFGRELEGVGKQVEQDALHPFAIGLGLQRGGYVDSVVNASFSRQ